MLKDTLLQKQLNVLLVGETCIDYYLEGTVKKKYSETKINGILPDNVPVLNVINEFEKPGMASNVEQNFLAIGHNVTFLTNHRKILKKRYIDKETKQHYLRADFFDNCEPLVKDDLLDIDLNTFDLIVISDYNKGLINKNLVDYLRNNYQGLIFVDSKKKDLSIYKNCIIKINDIEFKESTKIPKNCELIITKGSEGALHNNKTYSAYPAKNVIDICGAGDNFLAGLTIMYHATKDFPKSINFANYCAATCLNTIGVKPFTKKEIKDYVNKVFKM